MDRLSRPPTEALPGPPRVQKAGGPQHDRVGIRDDAELLYVASMLHDLGLVPPFDNHLAPFEDAGGDVGWVFGAGAGWPAERRERVKEIIVRHMWPEVDPALDAETAFEDQARRKPGCAAAAAVESGVGARLAANPLE